MLMFPHEFDGAVSTHVLVPGIVRLTVGLELPPTWLGETMASENKRLAIEAARYGGLVALPFGGAAFMSAFAAEIGALAGLVVGVGLGMVGFYGARMSGFNVEGGGAKLQLQLEAAAKTADDAKKYAQMAVEIAFIIANRPSGVLGGGLEGRNDGLRRLIAERLQEMNISDKEASKFARFDDAHIARRILQHLLLDRVVKSAAGGEARARDLSIPLLGADAPREPIAIRELLGPDLVADAGVADILDFYSAWHRSEAKLQFVVQNMDRLRETASKSLTSHPWDRR